MQIDWLTVAAQIVNFLVLVWLLKRFLYKPITDAMRRREERIEARLEEARATREEAEQKAQELEAEQAELEDSKDEILASARKDAEQLRERLETDIRDEMEDERAAWRTRLAEERDAFIASLRRKAGQTVLEVSGRVLSDYAGSDLSERVIATFADRVKELDPETRDKMQDAAAQEGAEATIHTATAIDSPQKGRITRSIHELLSADLDVTYQDDPDMVLGVRLTIGDYSAEWSAMRYLDRLETQMQEIIDAGSRNKDSAGASEESEKKERESA